MTHSELALHEGALISCCCAFGAGGLLDCVLYIVVHRHSHLDIHTHTKEVIFSEGLGTQIGYQELLK